MSLFNQESNLINFVFQSIMLGFLLNIVKNAINIVKLAEFEMSGGFDHLFANIFLLYSVFLVHHYPYFFFLVSVVILRIA